MYYVNRTPNESGNYGNPHSAADGFLLPDELLASYTAARGFVTVTVEDDVITSVETNAEALEAYLAEYPGPAEEEPEPGLDDVVNALLGVNA